MTITQRADVEGAECDVICTGRFYDFFEQRDGRWGLVLRQPIYESGPDHPGRPDRAARRSTASLLESFPVGYRHLAYLQTRQRVHGQAGHAGADGAGGRGAVRERPKVARGRGISTVRVVRMALKTLDETRAAALEALCELIVPGSGRVGPVVYIDALLANMPPPVRDHALDVDRRALAAGAGTLEEKQFTPEFAFVRALAMRGVLLRLRRAGPGRRGRLGGDRLRPAGRAAADARTGRGWESREGRRRGRVGGRRRRRRRRARRSAARTCSCSRPART